MKLSRRVETAGPGQINVRDIEVPEPGDNDVLVRVRACGICGSDLTMIGLGGRGAAIPLGHVVVADVVPSRLQLALEVGADAVINFAQQDVRGELTFIASMGYPTEIFEVTEEIAAHADRFGKLISHEIPFSEVQRAIQLALTPGAANKIVVTFP